MTLSRLQKTILTLALKEPGKVDVTAADVKVAYYGFPLNPRGPKILFDKRQIGFDRYNNASVAIARAFNHLERKGLAVRDNRWGGLKLTEKGREVAEKIRNDYFLRVTCEGGGRLITPSKPKVTVKNNEKQ